MPGDLSLLLLCVVPAALLGLGAGLALRRWRPDLSERYAAWSAALPWWFFAGFAGFFSLMALGQAARGWWSFAVLFAGFAVLEWVCLGLALGKRTEPPPAIPREARP